MKNTLSIILSLTLLIGCENNGQALKEPPKEVPETGFPKPVKAMYLTSSHYPGYCEGVEKPHQVINDEDSWHRLLLKMDSDCRRSVLLEVDFSRFMLIAAFAGSQEGLYPSVGIKGICEHENSIDVWVGEESSPQFFYYQVVKVPKTDKPVNFIKCGQDVGCGDGFHPSHFTGCEDSGQGSETGFPQSITPSLFNSSGDSNSRFVYCEGIEKPYQVIKDGDSWQRLLLKMNSDCRPSLRPKVDFSRFTVIAAFAGSKKGDYPSVVITEICEHENYISVDLAMLVISQPYDIVKIPKTNKPVKFVLSSSDVKCGD